MCHNQELDYMPMAIQSIIYIYIIIYNKDLHTIDGGPYPIHTMTEISQKSHK